MRTVFGLLIRELELLMPILMSVKGEVANPNFVWFAAHTQALVALTDLRFDRMIKSYITKLHRYDDVHFFRLWVRVKFTTSETLGSRIYFFREYWCCCFRWHGALFFIRIHKFKSKFKHLKTFE